MPYRRRFLSRPKRQFKAHRVLKTHEGLISYTLVRSSHRRNLTIDIDRAANVKVSVPFNTCETEINAFIHEKAQWILRNVKEAAQDKDILAQKTFEHGQRFLFLGKTHKIEVNSTSVKRNRIHFDGDKWTVALTSHQTGQKQQSQIKKTLVNWYRHQAKEIIGSRIFFYARQIGVEPKKITVRTQKNLWGSCYHHSKSINMNWQIIMSPMEVVDYVVVHELCHLLVPNHSKRFWQKVKKVMPDYVKHQKWLKTHRLEMMLP